MEEAVAQDALDPRANERFMGLLLNIADVKRRELAGSHEENLADIITDQQQLEKIMTTLKAKFEKLN